MSEEFQVGDEVVNRADPLDRGAVVGVRETTLDILDASGNQLTVPVDHWRKEMVPSTSEFQVGDLIESEDGFRCTVTKVTGDRVTYARNGIRLWDYASNLKLVSRAPDFKVGDGVAVRQDPLLCGKVLNATASGVRFRNIDGRQFIVHPLDLVKMEPRKRPALMVGEPAAKDEPMVSGEARRYQEYLSRDYIMEPPPAVSVQSAVSVQWEDWSRKQGEDGPGIAKKIPLSSRRFLSQTTSWAPYGDWDNLPDE